jgi:hypothetical protein
MPLTSSALEIKLGGKSPQRIKSISIDRYKGRDTMVLERLSTKRLALAVMRAAAYLDNF